MVAEQQYPDAVGVVAPEQIADQDQVVQGFAHLLAPVPQHADVRPDSSEGPYPGDRLRLRNLALVMWKDQVGSAAVHVNLVAQVGERHGRTLDVPARASFSPRTRPARFVGRTFLPEQEIERVLLAWGVRVGAAL